MAKITSFLGLTDEEHDYIDGHALLQLYSTKTFDEKYWLRFKVLEELIGYYLGTFKFNKYFKECKTYEALTEVMNKHLLSIWRLDPEEFPEAESVLERVEEEEAELAEAWREARLLKMQKAHEVYKDYLSPGNSLEGVYRNCFIVDKKLGIKIVVREMQIFNDKSFTIKGFERGVDLFYSNPAKLKEPLAQFDDCNYVNFVLYYSIVAYLLEENFDLTCRNIYLKFVKHKKSKKSSVSVDTRRLDYAKNPVKNLLEYYVNNIRNNRSES